MASLALQVSSSTPWRKHANAYGRFRIGLLPATATAPPGTATPATAPPAGCGTPGCQLPLTGHNIGIATGAGILILILGRLLLVLAARRSRA
jgi:hypothetical protein